MFFIYYNIIDENNFKTHKRTTISIKNKILSSNHRRFFLNVNFKNIELILKIFLKLRK